MSILMPKYDLSYFNLELYIFLYVKGWRRYILLQSRGNLTQLGKYKENHNFAIFVPVLTKLSRLGL